MKAHRGAIALTSTLILLSFGLAHAQCPSGDLNGDCKVDINDLILLLDHWTEE